MQKNQIIILLLIVAVFIFLILGGQQWLSLEAIRSHRDQLTLFTEQHYLIMLLACSLVYSLSTALSLPTGTVLSLLLGFLFGRWIGGFVIVVSATIGATAVFWLARYLFAEWAERRMQGHEGAKKIIDGFQADAFNYLLFLRLVPLFPFWLVNLAPAFTPVSLRVYVITTFLGIMPGSFIYANLGQSLGSIERLDQLLSAQTLWALALLGVLSLLPVIVKRYQALRLNGDSR